MFLSFLSRIGFDKLLRQKRLQWIYNWNMYSENEFGKRLWRSDISLGNISKKKGKNIPKLDFCKDTPIEPRKRVVRLVRPNFGTPGFGATFYAKKCYFWPFSPTSSVPNFIKTHSHFKNGNIYHSKKFWEIWCRESVKKWPKIAFFGPKTAIFGRFCMVGSIKLLGVVNIDSF